MIHEAIQIESAKNARLKQLKKLRQRRFRRKYGRTIVDGKREIVRAVEAGVRVEELFLSSDTFDAEDSNWLAQLQSQGTLVFRVSPELLLPYLFGERDEGCVAVTEIPHWRLEDLKLPKQPCVAVVERVEKPGNLGAILRSADGAGLAAVIVADPATDLMNPNVIRASMGTVFSVPTCTASIDDVLAWIGANELQVVSTRVEATNLYHEIDLTVATAIVLGNEADGLGERWQGASETAVRLPMFGVADSLNVSATAAVLFYEVMRQRSLAATSE